MTYSIQVKLRNNRQAENAAKLLPFKKMKVSDDKLIIDLTTQEYGGDQFYLAQLLEKAINEFTMTKEFSLWKHNKLDQRYTLTEKEILDRFFKSEACKTWKESMENPKWKPQRIDMMFMAFVAESEKVGGLESGMEMWDYTYFDGLLWNIEKELTKPAKR